MPTPSAEQHEIQPAERLEALRYRSRHRLILLSGLLLVAVMITGWIIWNAPLGPTLVSTPSSGSLSAETIQTMCAGPPVMFILMVGKDRSNPSNPLQEPGYKAGAADAIRIVRVDFVDGQVTILSLPRDLWVRLSGLESAGVFGARLSAVYAYGFIHETPGGGPSLMARTLGDNFGVQIDHYTVVSFDALTGAIDAMGGIDVDVPHDAAQFRAGLQHMDGEQALHYVRLRITADDSSDLDRIERQTRVLQAIQAQVRSPQVIDRLPQLARSLHQSVLTDLSAADLTTLLCLGRQLDGSDIVFIDLPPDLYDAQIDVSGRELFRPYYSQVRNYIEGFNGGQTP